MSSLGYRWRVTGRRSGRQIVLVALLGGLLGAVALGAVAGAQRTAAAYGRYLTAARISDALVNVPGKLPAEPVLRPIRLISALPGITAHATYLGLSDAPIVHGKPDFAGNAPRLLGSLDGEYFRQDKMTVLAAPATGLCHRPDRAHPAGGRGVRGHRRRAGQLRVPAL